jgi:hypothetical protein
MTAGVEHSVARGPGFKGFAAALMLGAALAGAAVVVSGVSTVVRVAAAGVTVAAWVAGLPVVARGRPRRFWIAAALALAVMGMWALQLVGMSPPFPMRSLHAAAFLCYAAVALAAALRILRLLDEPRALLLAFSIAVPVFIADAVVPPPAAPPRVTPWKVTSLPDPNVSFRYKPHSTGMNFYPDNPRGYFEQRDPLLDTWDVETHEGSEAELARQPASPPVIRVTIRKLTGSPWWYVKLQQAPYTLRKNDRYVLSFRARADRARRIACTVAQNEEPWELRAPYHELDLGTEWDEFSWPFVATASDSNARIYFDLGGDDAAVEVSGVTLRNLSSNQLETPRVKPVEYFISYRFNSLGFRGPDYAVPAPPNTFRILALGDSYAMGVGVHEKDTFEAQLQNRLNAAAAARRSSLTYEVINAGVSGYATREERLSYELFGSTYTPQVVLLTMVFNDDLSFQDEVKLGYISTTTPRGVSPLWDRLHAARSPTHRYDYTNAIQDVRLLNEACRQRGAKLAVAIFRNTNGFTPWLDLVKAANEGLKGTVPLIDLGPALLRDHPNEKELKVHAVDGHPNEIGHRLAAEELERFLRAEKLIPDGNS